MSPSTRRRKVPAAKLLAFAILAVTEANIAPSKLSLPLSGDALRRHRVTFTQSTATNFNLLNLRGGSDENNFNDPSSEYKQEAVASRDDGSSISNTDTAKKSGWFGKKKDAPSAEEPKEENTEGYVEFTMNSDGQTTSIDVQAPGLQNELNKTLNSLHELQNKVKEEEEFSKLISANGVANGGASSSGHMSAKFPIARDELPHFASMSVLMFLFIYVFTTGEFTWPGPFTLCGTCTLSLQIVFLMFNSKRYKRHSGSLQLRGRSHTFPQTLRSHALCYHVHHPLL